VSNEKSASAVGLLRKLAMTATTACCVVFIFLAFCDVTAFVTNARSGMLLFGNNVLPILFPFFFISSLLIELGARRFAIPLSFLAGNPTSARILAQLFERGEVTREQAIKTATYTSTTSPIFIIATVGAALYGDVRLGVIVFMAHVAGALLNGLLYCRMNSPFLKGGDTQRPERETKMGFFKGELSISDAISKSLYSSAQNIMAVGGLIIIFFIAAAPFGPVVASVLEMTTGIFQLSTSHLGRTQGPPLHLILTAIVSFGGLCVAMQSFVFLKTFQMPVWFYFLYKATHTLFAVAICAVFAILF